MNDEQMDALIETLESWGERADMPLSAIGSMHKAAKALTETRAELAELRARVPAICFPRQPNGEGGWVIDANYVAAIHKDCFPIEWQPCEEEVEAVLLAVERAAPVPQPAVPEDVAKDAERYRWIRSDMKMLWGDDVLAIIGESGASFDAAIDAAILAADTEGRKDGGAR